MNLLSPDITPGAANNVHKIHDSFLLLVHTHSAAVINVTFLQMELWEQEGLAQVGVRLLQGMSVRQMEQRVKGRVLGSEGVLRKVGGREY